MTDNPDSFNIHLYYNSDYEKKVAEGSPDSWIEVAIVANGIDICGDPEKKQGLTGYACGIQFDLLDVVESISSGEKGVIEFEFGPDWVVFEPKNEDTVRVYKSTTYSGIDDAKERLEIDPSTVVSKKSIRTEAINTVCSFIEHIVDINPEIRTQETVSELREQLEEMR
jgi:hypothetical protein